MSESLPVYRVRARNTSAHSENKIHDDALARTYGFRGGLVPGIIVYAYMTEPLVHGLGEAWLRRGTAHARFRRPIVDGDHVTAAGEVTARTPTGLNARVTARTDTEGECGVAEATLPAGSPTPVNVAMYPTAPLPSERPLATREHFSGLDVLGTPETTYDAERAAGWLERIDDPRPFYRAADAWVHPAFYLEQANRAIDRNVRVGPWIHVESRIRHLGGARMGETLQTRGRVRSLYERKGREYVELDLLVVALGGTRPRPVAHVIHTAIYRLPSPGGVESSSPAC